MSIDLDDKLVETAQRVQISTNEFGDIDYGTGVSVPCLYRDISTLNQAANRYEVGIDGILWFKADEPVTRGAIYYHPDEGYLKIVKITRAKTLVTTNQVMFIRCQVSKQRQIS